MTDCAPLCGLSAIRKVTSRRSPQTPPCQKRVAGVCHPAKSAQPKVAGEPGGRKKCRIKAGGRLRAPRPATPPRRAGRGFSIGGRNFHFLLWQVTDIRKFRKKTAVFRHSIRWLSQVVFWHFTGISAGVSFHPLGSSRGSVFTPWGQAGGQFFLCSYSHHKIGKSRRGYLRMSRGALCHKKNKFALRISP